MNPETSLIKTQTTSLLQFKPKSALPEQKPTPILKISLESEIDLVVNQYWTYISNLVQRAKMDPEGSSEKVKMFFETNKSEQQSISPPKSSVFSKSPFAKKLVKPESLMFKTLRPEKTDNA